MRCSIGWKTRSRLSPEQLSAKNEGVSRERTLQAWGNLVSTEGSIEVLDHYFKPERITFDYPRGTRNPIISGRAYTTIIDSLGIDTAGKS